MKVKYNESNTESQTRTKFKKGAAAYRPSGMFCNGHIQDYIQTRKKWKREPNLTSPGAERNQLGTRNSKLGAGPQGGERDGDRTTHKHVDIGRTKKEITVRNDRKKKRQRKEIDNEEDRGWAKRK